MNPDDFNTFIPPDFLDIDGDLTIRRINNNQDENTTTIAAESIIYPNYDNMTHRFYSLPDIVQELQAQVSDLTEKVKTLENQNKRLKRTMKEIVHYINITKVPCIVDDKYKDFNKLIG